jgi:hypothetical protein
VVPPPAAVTGPAVQTVVERVPARTEPSGGRLLPWVGVGATAAFTGGAIAAGLSANSKFSKLRSTCGQTHAGCSDAQISGLKSTVLLTNLLWVGAGLAAVSTGVAFYLQRDEGGVTIAGRF